MRIIVSVTCIWLAAVTSGCSGNSKVTPGSTTTVPMSTAPCPLVTDGDLAKLNPVLKRAGDGWEEHNGSIYCWISFGVNMMNALKLSGNVAPKPFEILEVSVMRSADISVDRRVTRDTCTRRGYAHIGECEPLEGVGEYAFYEKILGPPKVYMSNGLRYGHFPSEGVRSVSGPYEITVLANYWKGGNPRSGTIELAKKLAAQLSLAGRRVFPKTPYFGHYKCLRKIVEESP